MSKSTAIKTDKLCKTYQETNALNNLDLEIPQGSIFGLLGPNGAGKTTLISILAGLIKPTSGSAYVKGRDVLTESSAIKQIIGVIPQDIALYPKLTSKENLQFFGSLYNIETKQLGQLIDNYMDIMGLADKTDVLVHKLSGGMKRRLNIIAGILHQPQIVFLDEPTVGVDVQSKKLIIDYLKELNASGTTMLYTSHYLEEAQNFCTDVGIIDEGKLITSGAVNDLINGNKSLEDLYIQLTGRHIRD